MNVLIGVIVSFVFLDAFNLYVPKEFRDINISNANIRLLKNVNKINFNNSLALLSYKYLPFILEKNLTMITQIGEIDKYILTHKKSLSELKTVANLDYASKILLDSVNDNYKSVKGNLKDFLNNKFDAIVFNKNIEKEGIFNFRLKDYDIEMNKYFLVGSRDFIQKIEK
ncbi:hypothetical protein JCM11957_16500 [Caminibacter profundus]